MFPLAAPFRRRAPRDCCYKEAIPLSPRIQVGSHLERIRESNRQARDGWARSAGHRARVQAILSGLGAPGASLCLLGPGHLNDVRLDELLERFAEIHLVDVDSHTVRSALERRGVLGRPGLVLHRADLTGILELLPATAVKTDPGDIAERLVRTLAAERYAVPGSPFDVTASTGVLTQLLQSVVDAGLPEAETQRVSLALRDKHLTDLVSLTRTGGTFVLVSDVVSTASAPQLARAAELDLEEEMATLVASRNFFTGTNPYRVVAVLEEDPRFHDLVSDVRLRDPWLWAVTSDREHLTYAIVARRV